MTATITQPFDDRSTLFTYSGTWFHGTWNASSVGETGTLSTTNDVNATVSFTFPVSAVSFAFFGIQRSRGGSYGICVDCDPNNPNFLPVDGFNATDNGANPPVALYTQNFSQPAVHAIIIRNQADSRGTPVGNSQLTLDRIDLQVLDNSTPATVTVVASASTLSASGTGSAIPLETSPSSPSPSKSSPPIGAIVGGVLGALALIAILFVFLYWLRLRRQRTRVLPQPLPMEETIIDGPRPSLAVAQPAVDYAATTVPSSSRTPQWRAGYGHGGNEKYGHRLAPSSDATTSAPTNYTSTFSPPPTSNASSSSRPRREQDAGPVPLSPTSGSLDENHTLPPDYTDVFRERSWGRPPS